MVNKDLIFKKLEYMGYIEVYTDQDQIHFVNKKYLKSFVEKEHLRHYLADYIYNYLSNSWIKARIKIENLGPITEAERLFYEK